MLAIREAVRLLAEYPGTYGPEPPAGAPVERVRDPRFTLILTAAPSSQMVEALDLGEDVAGALEDVRATLRRRGRTRAVWFVAPTSQPAGLLEQLHACGLRAADEPPWEPVFTSMVLLVGILDGEIVGVGRSIVADAGVNLSGGSVHPEARGRGVYRALVRARWDDSVARGTPALTVQAGRMSRPALARLGFGAVSEQHCLIDRFEGEPS